ncbi:hypothetical protein [Saccharopolyspora taberi]|uniref:Uncharacterized protein n=1 Tax=Saccharopolyspora taberi TaxID=60895 RepID=A0ABN3VE04_9PSEU
MVIERYRWVRRLLVGQPAVVWPCSWLLWSGGTNIGLAAAVVLLWASALGCVVSIVAPMRRQETRRC